MLGGSRLHHLQSLTGADVSTSLSKNLVGLGGRWEPSKVNEQSTWFAFTHTLAQRQTDQKEMEKKPKGTKRARGDNEKGWVTASFV